MNDAARIALERADFLDGIPARFAEPKTNRQAIGRRRNNDSDIPGLHHRSGIDRRGRQQVRRRNRKKAAKIRRNRAAWKAVEVEKGTLR